MRASWACLAVVFAACGTVSNEGAPDAPVDAFVGPPGSVTYRLMGRVTSIDDVGGVLSGIAANDAISGMYTIDPTLADMNVTDATVGDYRHTTAGYGMVIQIAGYDFRDDPSAPDFLLEVVDRTNDDDFGLRSYNPTSTPLSGVTIINWQLGDPTGTALVSDAILTSPPNLATWSTQSFQIEGMIGTDSWFVIGTIDYVGP